MVWDNSGLDIMLNEHVHSIVIVFYISKTSQIFLEELHLFV